MLCATLFYSSLLYSTLCYHVASTSYKGGELLHTCAYLSCVCGIYMYIYIDVYIYIYIDGEGEGARETDRARDRIVSWLQVCVSVP